MFCCTLPCRVFFRARAYSSDHRQQCHTSTHVFISSPLFFEILRSVLSAGSSHVEIGNSAGGAVAVEAVAGRSVTESTAAVRDRTNAPGDWLACVPRRGGSRTDLRGRRCRTFSLRSAGKLCGLPALRTPFEGSRERGGGRRLPWTCPWSSARVRQHAAHRLSGLH